jgi:hypothetical protein
MRFIDQSYGENTLISKLGRRALRTVPDMQDALEFVVFPAIGLVFGVGFIVLARWSGLKVRHVLAYGLIAVAFVYVAFSGRSDNPTVWLGFEMTGVAIFGSFALLSIIGSPWWLVVGFALHPLWAIVFHYIGTGREFTPNGLALANAAFDLTIAAYVVYDHWRGASVSPRTEGAPMQRNKRGAK